LVLGGGNRRFGLGVIRGEAEVKNQTLTYAIGATTGTARILGEPPRL
jgi:hypothetical protein